MLHLGGSPAARGCSIEGGGVCFGRELPLAARACSILEGEKRLLLGELRLRGAAR